jgi:hypothetical protein
MFKLITSSLVFMTLSAGFLFSKEISDHPCKESLTGIVREYDGPEGLQLMIEGTDRTMYLPVIEKESIVLASGTKVRVCIDIIDAGTPMRKFRINHVSYLP